MKNFQSIPPGLGASPLLQKEEENYNDAQPDCASPVSLNPSLRCLNTSSFSPCQSIAGSTSQHRKLRHEASKHPANIIPLLCTRSGYIFQRNKWKSTHLCVSRVHFQGVCVHSHFLGWVLWRVSSQLQMAEVASDLGVGKECPCFHIQTLNMPHSMLGFISHSLHP